MSIASVLTKVQTKNLLNTSLDRELTSCQPALSGPALSGHLTFPMEHFLWKCQVARLASLFQHVSKTTVSLCSV
jgi:hypothetical protein